jgi:hypothetical protein
MVSIAADVAPGRAVSRERPMYVRAAMVAALIVFAGFAPTYYLKTVFGTADLTTLKHVHGVVMTSWFALFATQAWLVSRHNVRLHRQLGVAGVLLAVLVVAVGMQLGIASARAGATPIPDIPPLVFLVMPVGELVIFATLFTAAIAMRNRPAWHKRFMLLASVAILSPAFARIPFVASGGPPAFFGFTDLVILACIAFDTVKNRRLHPAFAAGFVWVLVCQFGRIAVAQTPQWMEFARWLVG